MKLRNKLVTKYFIKEYDSETELFEAIAQYRIECAKLDISADENITKYLNGYELLFIDNLLTTTKQTETFKRWYKKAFGSAIINKNFWGSNKKPQEDREPILTSDIVYKMLYSIGGFILIASLIGKISMGWLCVGIPIILISAYESIDN